MIERGSVHWVQLGEPAGSAPAKRRPVLVVQEAPYNTSQIATTVVAVVTSNTQLAEYPGNVFLPAVASGLPKDSVVNVSQLVTVDKGVLSPAVGSLPAHLLAETRLAALYRRISSRLSATVATLSSHVGSTRLWPLKVSL